MTELVTLKPLAICPDCGAPSKAVCSLKFHVEGRGGSLFIHCPSNSPSCPLLRSWVVYGEQAERDSGSQMVYD